MALATAGVSLAIRDSGEQQLEREAQRLVLGPEPLIPRQSITLSLPGSNSAPLRLATDGLRPFSIQSLQVTP